MHKVFSILLYTLFGIIVIWTLLTVWVQFGGKHQAMEFGKNDLPAKALIVYNPDPIYNFDEKICRAVGEELSKKRFAVKLATTKYAKELESDFDLYVFCANTYNWAPDWQVSRFIKHRDYLVDADVIAITLGAGSTGKSKRLFEELLKEKQVNLLSSQTYWLLRPNDESRMDENNVEVAIDLVRTSIQNLTIDN